MSESEETKDRITHDGDFAYFDGEVIFAADSPLVGSPSALRVDTSALAKLNAALNQPAAVGLTEGQRRAIEFGIEALATNPRGPFEIAQAELSNLLARDARSKAETVQSNLEQVPVSPEVAAEVNRILTARGFTGYEKPAALTPEMLSEEDKACIVTGYDKCVRSAMTLRNADAAGKLNVAGKQELEHCEAYIAWANRLIKTN